MIILQLVETLKRDSLEYCQFQIAAHNKHKHLLQRDTSIVIILTFVVLFLGAFLANTCVQILRHHGYVYTTSSFGKYSCFVLLRAIEIIARHVFAQVIIFGRFHRENIRVYVYEACQSTSTVRVQQHAGEIYVSRIISCWPARNTTWCGYEYRVRIPGVTASH